METVIGNTLFFDWEVSLIVWLQNNVGPIGEKLAMAFTYLGEPLTLVLVIGLFYWGLDKKFGKDLAACLYPVCLWGSMLKNVILRRRPYMDHEAIRCIRPAEKGDIYDIALQGYSFPSLHAANSSALFFRVGRYTQKTVCRVILYLLPLLVSLSRVILGVHYPTDVLAGWALGILTMLVIGWLLKKLPNRGFVFLILLISGFPGFFFCASKDFYTSYGLILGSAAGFFFEEKHVNFGDAENLPRALLRVAGGVALYLGLSALLKLPFPKELLASETTASFLIRTGRYALIAFLILGVYPLCFPKNSREN